MCNLCPCEILITTGKLKSDFPILSLIIWDCLETKQTWTAHISLSPLFKLINPKFNGHNALLSVYNIFSPHVTNSTVIQPSSVV